MQPQALAAALGGIAQDSTRLALERTQRFSESPPQCPSSGETTIPPTPTPMRSATPPLDPVQRYWLLHDQYSASFPSRQFSHQAKRVRERLIQQTNYSRQGRRQTLPFNEQSDFQANAENIVRDCWLAQKIWKSSWGPAWPPGTNLSMYLGPHPDGPKGVGEEWTHERHPGQNDMAQLARSTSQVDLDDDEDSQIDHDASRPLDQFLYQLPQE